MLTTEGVLIWGGGGRNTNQAGLYCRYKRLVVEVAPMKKVRDDWLRELRKHCLRIGRRWECHHLRELEVGRVDTMADMIEKHSWFTSAVLVPFIYLCGGNTSHCEVFDPAMETCVDMRISLPHSLEACAFAYKQGLIVLQRGWISRIHEGNVESQTTPFSVSPRGTQVLL